MGDTASAFRPLNADEAMRALLVRSSSSSVRQNYAEVSRGPNWSFKSLCGGTRGKRFTMLFQFRP